MILLPVKNLKDAKQRLAPVLDPEARLELARAMLSDTLGALAACRAEKVSLVTGDPFAIELARGFGCGVIPDRANTGESDAIQAATQVCVARGIPSTLVLPADIPLVTAEEIRTILESAPPRGSLLVPSRDMRGTNAVVRRPAALFPLRFGNDSFLPHLRAALRAGGPCLVVSLPGIALDVDTPDDLRQLARTPGERPSQLLARKARAGEAEALSPRDGKSPQEADLVRAK